MSAFEGTQPVLRQSPPILWRSTSVTLAFTAAAMYAETNPAEPAPITTMLRSNFAGFGHFAYTLRARIPSTIFFTARGNTARIRNAVMRPGERTSLTDVTWASCVPAYTYANVPANIPT